MKIKERKTFENVYKLYNEDDLMAQNIIVAII